jgi:uncharacterized membrane protein YgcG
MHRMLTALKKRLAIRSYVRKLGPALQRRYGRKRYYTPEEVRRAARDTGVNTDYLFYGYSLYCSRGAFDEHHRETGEHCDYDAMRAEVGAAHFEDSTSFDATHVIDTGASSHHSGSGWGDSGGGESGGSDSGGGD